MTTLTRVGAEQDSSFADQWGVGSVDLRGQKPCSTGVSSIKRRISKEDRTGDAALCQAKRDKTHIEPLRERTTGNHLWTNYWGNGRECRP